MSALVTCQRCNGAGGWIGWPGFTCYRCHGTGRAHEATTRQRATLPVVATAPVPTTPTHVPTDDIVYGTPKQIAWAESIRAMTTDTCPKAITIVRQMIDVHDAEHWISQREAIADLVARLSRDAENEAALRFLDARDNDHLRAYGDKGMS